MKSTFCIHLLTLSLTAFSLCADQNKDPWKGDEYAKNSESQKASAEDFMQDVQFKGTE